MNTEQIEQYIEQHKDRFLEELLALLRIQSISALEEHNGDVHAAAAYVRDRLVEAGVDKAQLHETKGHPIVYGEKMIDPQLPTVLVYGHYDVQPADPLELWKSPPFEPEIRNGKIYGRGTSDDKGQAYIHIKAFEVMERAGSLACNVKFMIEGEEEIGSPNLEIFVQEHTDMLQCDVIVISDTAMISNEHPSISTGLKGLSYLEVKVSGPNRDLHSGTYGGAVANPAIVLAKMIASLTDDRNRITIPGFYDKVVELSREERDRLAEAPYDEEEFKKELDVEELAGEKGYTIPEQLGIRPTLDVNGIWGGYTGKGAKTVLPSEASAKISMRLVPDQDHHEITKLFINHIKSIAPRSVKVEITPQHGGQPAVTPIDSVAFKAAEKAFEDSWGKTPVPTRDGGSIPIVALFEQVLKSHTILMGMGLDSDAIHSPNESFGLFNFYKGIETVVLFHQHFAALRQSKE